MIPRTERPTRSAPASCWNLGAEVISLYDQPNGMSINQGCGSLYPEVICRVVVANKAHLGIAFDGDADRVILCDENGKVVDGDGVMAVCALHMIRQGRLNHNVLVATVMSNLWR